MRFNTHMLAMLDVYKMHLRLYGRGECSAATFLMAHAEWNKHVEKWEEEHSSATNYGAF
jgi:hypothetical protein